MLIEWICELLIHLPFSIYRILSRAERLMLIGRHSLLKRSQKSAKSASSAVFLLFLEDK